MRDCRAGIKHTPDEDMGRRRAAMSCSDDAIATRAQTIEASGVLERVLVKDEQNPHG